jgi:hypothetical protein
MDRRQLESAGASYPSTHLQGLYGISFCLVMSLIGASNLNDPPWSPWALGGGVLLCLASFGAVTLYYQRGFGRVTPLRSRQIKYVIAAVAGFAVYVASDQLLRGALGRPPEQPVSTTVATWALGMLVFYALGTGLTVHRIVIWVAVLAAGCLPIWGLDTNRDAIAYFPLGAAILVSGLFDHYLLVRTFRSYRDLNLEGTNAGA